MSEIMRPNYKEIDERDRDIEAGVLKEAEDIADGKSDVMPTARHLRCLLDLADRNITPDERMVDIRNRAEARGNHLRTDRRGHLIEVPRIGSPEIGGQA